MKYSDFSELCKQKGIKIKDVLIRIGYSRPGLESALDNETIALKSLKLLCDAIRISPSLFFDVGEFGVPQHSIAPSKKVEELEKEIDYLKKSLQDKEDIINLLREKGTGYGIVAEPYRK